MPPPVAGPTAALKPRALDRIRAHHPWIYRSDVGEVEAKGGALVAVVDHRGRVRGHALYSDRSEIALRMVSYGSDPWDAGIWAGLLDRALKMRADLFPEADALRLPTDTKPSEQFKRQCFISGDPDETAAPHIIDHVGADLFLAQANAFFGWRADMISGRSNRLRQRNPSPTRRPFSRTRPIRTFWTAISGGCRKRSPTAPRRAR